MELALLILGFFVLVKGADFLVDGAVSIAKHLKVSHVVVGLTVVAFGTSLPELFVTLLSSVKVENEILIGTMLGSNIANILLMLGLCASLHAISVRPQMVWHEMPFMILVSLILFGFVSDNVLSQTDGKILLCVFVFFLIWMIHRGKKSFFEDEDEGFKPHSLSYALGHCLLGIVGLYLGGEWIIEGAIYIATHFGVAESTIGLTIVAVGTTLPEIAASVTAVRKSRVGIAIGNAVGSNIFNILMVLGVHATIKDIPYSPSFNSDMYFVLGAALLLWLLLLTKKGPAPMPFWKRITKWELGPEYILERWEGGLFLVIYGVYVWSLI